MLEFKNLKLLSKNNTKVLPGSGINLEYFSYSAPPTSTPLTFLFIGRFLKDKGIIEYSQAATYLAKSHPNVNFKI